MRIDATPCYILHSRPFKDSSALLDCFSRDHGLVSLIARGAKRPASRLSGVIQPFILLQIGWSGRTDLKTLTQIEAEKICPLKGEKILLGLYLNELIIRLLERYDPYPEIFEHYHAVIHAILQSNKMEEHQLVLRRFELTLLAKLGYGVELSCDRKGQSLVPDLLYTYDPLVGITESLMVGIKGQVLISGASLIAFIEGTPDPFQLQEIKKLMRFILSQYLGNKPLQSRKLFSSTLK